MLRSQSCSSLWATHRERDRYNVKPPLLLKKVNGSGAKRMSERLNNFDKLKPFFQAMDGKKRKPLIFPDDDPTKMKALHSAIKEVEKKGFKDTLVSEEELSDAKRRLNKTVMAVIKRKVSEHQSNHREGRSQSCSRLLSYFDSAPPIECAYTKTASRLKSRVCMIKSREDLAQIRRIVLDDIARCKEASILTYRNPGKLEISGRRLPMRLEHIQQILNIFIQFKWDPEICSTACDIGKLWSEDFYRTGKDELDHTQLEKRREILLIRGFGVMGADTIRMHSEDREIGYRCSRNGAFLLGLLNLDLLFNVAETMVESVSVSQGIVRAMVMVAKEGAKIDQLALLGCRELMQEYVKRFPNDHVLRLQVHAVKRLLSRSPQKSKKIVSYTLDWTLEDLKSIRQFFDELDPDETGEIPITSLKPLFVSLGMKVADQDLNELMKVIDVDGSGSVAWAELLFLIESYGGVRNFSIESQFSKEKLAELRSVFEMFDSDGSGDIDCSELRAVMKEFGLNPTKKELIQMIKTYDADQSGTIDWYEFLFMMSRTMGNTDKDDAYNNAFKFFESREEKGKIKCNEFKKKIAKIAKGKVTEEDVGYMITTVKLQEKSEDFNNLTLREFTILMSAGD